MISPQDLRELPLYDRYAAVLALAILIEASAEIRASSGVPSQDALDLLEAAFDHAQVALAVTDEDVEDLVCRAVKEPEWLEETDGLIPFETWFRRTLH